MESLIFGALISATDPVTVLAIFQVSIPPPPGRKNADSARLWDPYFYGGFFLGIHSGYFPMVWRFSGELLTVYSWGFNFFGGDFGVQELGADTNLYALVFGESVLNDAVAIVMYR